MTDSNEVKLFDQLELRIRGKRYESLAKAIYKRSRSIWSGITGLPWRFRSHFTLQSIAKGHHEYRYRGVVMRKSPFDLALLMKAVDETRPEVIIEIGTNFGGSALFLADQMQHYCSPTVLTLDVHDHGVPDSVTDDPRIVRFLGGWQEFDVNTCPKGKTMVIDDGSHTRSDVIGALEKFSPLVSVGCFYVVEDGCLSGLGLHRMYDGGPLAAIRSFMRHNGNFVHDKSYANFFGRNATFAWDGWLKRVV